jgi:hypothetical protein
MTQSPRSIPPARRLAAIAILTLFMGGMVSACGKEGPPQPPSGDESLYPRTYPEGATPS